MKWSRQISRLFFLKWIITVHRLRLFLGPSCTDDYVYVQMRWVEWRTRWFLVDEWSNHRRWLNLWWNSVADIRNTLGSMCMVEKCKFSNQIQASTLKHTNNMRVNISKAVFVCTFMHNLLAYQGQKQWFCSLQRCNPVVYHLVVKAGSP